MSNVVKVERSPFQWETIDGWSMSGSVWLPDRAVSQDLPVPTLPVVLVHGLGEHAGRYDSFANHLVALGHTVYAMDLRGHGHSAGVRGDAPSLQHLIDDLHLFVQQVRQKSGQEILLAAHSMGGLLGTLLALQYPQQLAGLLLISPYYRPAFQPKWWRLMVGRVFYNLYPGLTLDVGLQLQHLAQDETVRQSIVADPLSHQRLSARWAMEALQVGDDLPLLRQRLTVPTVIVHGDSDKISCDQASQFFARHQNQLAIETASETMVEFESLSGGFHQIHNDQSSRQQVLDAFMRLRQRVLQTRL